MLNFAFSVHAVAYGIRIKRCQRITFNNEQPQATTKQLSEKKVCNNETICG